MGIKGKTSFVAVAVLTLLIGLGCSSALAYRVTAQVINKSEPEKKIEGLPLTLYLLRQREGNLEVLKKLEGKTDSEGIYTFILEEKEKGTYLGVDTVFRGTSYSTPLQAVGDREEYKLAIPVYEISDSGDLVHIKERRIFVRGIQDGEILLSEIITISNKGNKTYVGRFNDSSDMHEVVRLGMPGGYERPSISRVTRDSVVLRGNGIVINERIKPGEKTILLSYSLRTDIGRLELRYPVDTPYEKFSLLLPEDIDWNIKTIRLEKKKDVALGGVNYRQWEGTDIKKGAAVIVRLKSPEQGGIVGINELFILGGLV
ncbi:MAG: hypothetical protein ACE5IH_07400, partial [Thermodesulfobacteriota bacterium]